MTPFQTYKLYLALKNHFTTDDYDFFKYQGKVTVSKESYEARPDISSFRKLAKHHDPIHYILANLLKYERVAPFELAYSEDCQKTYQDWRRRTQSLSYTMQNELGRLGGSLPDLMKVRPGYPRLFWAYLAELASLETMIVLLKETNMFDCWDEALKNDPVWQIVRRKVQKYTPFVRYDIHKMRAMLARQFEETPDELSPDPGHQDQLQGAGGDRRPEDQPRQTPDELQ